MPNTQGEPKTRVILSITDGKSGMAATLKTEGSWDGCGGLAGKLNGNLNGLVGK